MRRRAILIPDTGNRVGLGHVGRCAALAQALTTLGWDARVLVKDDVAARWVRSLSVKTLRRPTGRWSVVVVDSYLRPTRVPTALARPATRIVAIDDLHQVPRGRVDLIVRPSLGERRASRVLGGADYVLLRKDYWRRGSRRLSRTVRRVLVTLGGFANSGLTRRVIDSVRQGLPEAEIIVVGKQIPGSRLSSVRFVGRVASLRPLLERADMAVTAGGQTMNEALACGTPTLVLGTAANQRRNVSAATRANVIRAAGWASAASWPASLRRRASRLAARHAERVRLGRRARRLVDGRGALRVASALENL